VTGAAAEEIVYAQQELIKKMKEMLGSNNIEQAIQKLNDDNAAYRKKIEEFEKQQVVNFCKELEQETQDINGVQVLSKITGFGPDILRNAAFQLRNAANRIVVLGSVFDNKPNLVVAISDDLLGRFEAPKIVRAVGKLIQGGGGGQPSLSTAGGKNPDGLPDAMAEVLKLIAEN
jgi:alanyl-tRNA synthetase